jgi:hypothetical protein
MPDDEGVPVYTLFRGSEAEPPMRLDVRDGTIILTADRGDESCAVVRMTPHRAHAIGQRLIEMAAGVVKTESRG